MSAPGPDRKRPNIRDVAVAALAAADRVLAHWLPDGARKGAEYVARNPRRTDGRRGSFSVNATSGAWADFATGDKGGDLVALVAYLDGVKQGEAAKRLAAFLGMDARSAPAADARAPAAGKPDAALVSPIPDGAPPAPQTHSRHGRPSQTWTYRDAAGRALFHVVRFDTADGKQVLPLSLWDEGGAVRWHWRGVPQPRPLYGLDHLAARAGALVVVCEGEKDTDAAGSLLPDCVAITSPNGSRSAGAADWSPLRGRRVVVWPDADEPGSEYARAVVKHARKAGAVVAAVLDLDALAELRGAALPVGWGAADALAEGMEGAALGRVVAEAAAQAARRAAPQSPALAARRSPFVLLNAPRADQRAGVYHVPTVRDRATGEQVEGVPEWICSPLRVEALTRDASGGEWGRLLCFPDRDGVEHRWAMPCAMLAKDGAELRETLLAQGLEITAAQSRRMLVEYIQAAEPGRFARCVARTGWHGDAFVLADRAIGPAKGEELVFQSATADGCKVSAAGTLETWRDEVAGPCAGNSRLVLAVSAALAAPCLHLVGMEGGGLHLRGGSSSGKSTALAVAASVYGPREYRREWRATDNALESVAAMHSDALLPLDEIGQLDPKHAAAVAYLLSNGQGKSRSRRDGTLRAPATWRLLFLSCGEVGLHDLIAEAGGRHRAGMEVRVVDIPADAGAGIGVFERVPAGMAPGAFADHLQRVSAASYGTAFPAFLDVLTRDAARVREALGRFVAGLVDELAPDDAGGQVRRVAQRMALIGAAGEIASLHGITGWPSGEAAAAVRACFAAWLEGRGGPGESEPRAMVRQVQAFIATHSEGRFAPMERADDDRAPKTLMRAGYRVGVEGVGVEHWVFPETWRNEVCKGFDPVAVARELARRELLMPDASKGYTRRERVRGIQGGMVRVYRLLPGILDLEP
ncbi:MAG: DUF927 domain-containing protein [Xanthomonadales bacterium]|nr:DUF927 domain-containing protein [Xanthomonadales bacterium]